MSNTTNLGLPYMDANQNQKYVTYNSALQLLDALVQIQVQSASLTTPPASPSDGQCWIVGAGATGAWVGKDLNLAAWQSGAWTFIAPKAGYLAYNLAISTAIVWNGTAWVSLLAASVPALQTVAQSAHGANAQIGVLEELLTLSGSTTTSTIQIPNRAIVLGVSSLVVTSVTGAPSFGVGVAGNATQFGGSLGVTAGSNNSGVIGPTAFYAATNVVLTATSGSFTGGAVRIAVHYMLCGPPTS